MVNESELVELIQEAKKSEKERKFKQSLELYITFKDIDVKKGFALNEVIQLPKQMSQPAKICVMASGDMGIKAKSANADEVIESTKDRVSNNLLNFFIYPPINRFLKTGLQQDIIKESTIHLGKITLILHYR